MSYAIKTKDPILSFRVYYSFLSNFYNGNVFVYNNMKFKNAESAFQSRKDDTMARYFEMLNPLMSKNLGRKVNLRNDWEEIKDKIMYEVCYEKFTQCEKLKNKLLETGDRELVEGNNYGDTYWGMVYNNKTNEWVGENKLGIILMTVRDNIRENNIK